MRDLRALPASFDARVGGDAAEFVDQQQAIADRLPAAIALLVGLTLRRALADDRLGRAAGQGRADERPDRRRGARPAHDHLPGRAPDRAARLHAQRRRRAERLPRHRGDRLRALDGLRRVPARPDQGGARRRRRRPRGRRPRARPDRSRGHRRGDPARRRDRRVQHELDLVHPADRRRHRDRRADRRLRRADVPRALADGAARPLELVVAAAAAARCTRGSGCARPRPRADGRENVRRVGAAHPEPDARRLGAGGAAPAAARARRRALRRRRQAGRHGARRPRRVRRLPAAGAAGALGLLRARAPAHRRRRARALRARAGQHRRARSRWSRWSSSRRRATGAARC